MPAASKLTPARVAKFAYNANGPKLQRLWDSQVVGLGYELFPSGATSWIFRFRWGGVQKIWKLAPGCVALDDARSLATAWALQLAQGRLPRAAAEDTVAGVAERWQADPREALIKSRSSRRDAVGARFFNVAKRAEQCLASIDLLPDRGRVLCLCALAPGAPWALQANRARLARTGFAKANRVCSWATFFSRPL